MTCACVSECDQCCCENDHIVESESTATDPESCERNAQRVAEAEADREVECVDVADVLAGCVRVRHGEGCWQ